MRRLVLACLLPVALAAGCAHRGVAPSPEPVAKGWTEKGLASWYGKPYHGRRAASGEIYDMHEMTAAHRTLPFGTRVRVTRRDTGDSVVVRINDRGPFVKGRIIDLSYAAARKIGLDRDGVAPVTLKVVDLQEATHSKPAGHSSAQADDGCWWVQVGAFGELSNAEGARDRLRSAGERAVIVEGPGGLHRVRVGPLESRKLATHKARALAGVWPHAEIVPCG